MERSWRSLVLEKPEKPVLEKPVLLEKPAGATSGVVEGTVGGCAFLNRV